MSTTTVIPRRSTGRVVHPLWASVLIIEAFWTWYKRNWRSSVTSSVLQPVLYLVALGIGFGSQVEPSATTLGLPYVQYLAPALLVASALQTVSFDSTYPILSGFKWQRVYIGMAATPITAGQIAAGQLIWIALRLALTSAVFLLVATLLGAVTGPGVLLSLVFAVLAAMAFAAPVVAYSATVDGEGQQFNVIFRFIVMPMTLFAGTYFPVDQLPVWVRPLAWITPLWHGTELSRAAALGGLEPWPTIGHLAFLLAMLAVGCHLTRRNFIRRLAV